MSQILLPTYEDVAAASARIAGHAHRTPVLTSRTANEELGAQVFFKCENFQRMGAFKFRGAYNALAQLSPEQARSGVIAFSSGNHAQAVAQRLSEERGLALIPPFDHPHVIAGQGTAAKELIEDAVPLDALLVPCG